jgi:hypothetical protein
MRLHGAWMLSTGLLLIVDAFRESCCEHRSPGTYRWYRDRGHEFAGSTDRRVTVNRLRPYHVQQWIDGREGYADGSGRNGVRAAKRASRWAPQPSLSEPDSAALC